MNKRLIFLLLTFCCTSLLACRKDLLHWQSVEQIPVDPSAQLNTAVFLPNGVGIVAGGARFETARILVSTDKGLSWNATTMSPDTRGFFGACVSPDNKVYCCGLGLTLCKSTDAMNSYTLGRVPGPYEFMPALAVAAPSIGIGVVNVTTDSGAIVRFQTQDCNLLSYQKFNFALNDIEMFDSLRGIAVGSGAVLKTLDAGLTWTRLPVVGDNFTSISAVDSQHIFICGLAGFIVKSDDAGATWQRLRNGSNLTLPQYKFWDILCLNQQQIYAVGEKGCVVYSDDGGTHWMEFDRFTRNNLRFIKLCPDGKLLLGGENGSLFRLQAK